MNSIQKVWYYMATFRIGFVAQFCFSGMYRFFLLLKTVVGLFSWMLYVKIYCVHITYKQHTYEKMGTEIYMQNGGRIKFYHFFQYSLWPNIFLYGSNVTSMLRWYHIKKCNQHAIRHHTYFRMKDGMKNWNELI